MSNNNLITLHPYTLDGWGRVVFKGDNGKFYKTVELGDETFLNWPRKKQLELMQSLHTTSRSGGEPDYPCWDDQKFTLAE